MAADLTARSAPSRAGAHRRPPRLHAERADARLAFRQTWLGALVVLASVGVLLWLGTAAFHKSRESGGGLLTALAGNPAVRAVYGLPTAIDTVGGFAVWRVQLFVTLIGAVWVTLATTRVLRGNEETGRLDLMLANPLSLAGATVASLATLMAAPVLAVVVTGAVLQSAGASAAGSWLYGAGIGLLFATFVAIAALASQLVPERRRAVGFGTAVLFATFVVRMWADGAKSSGWARWATPFGWVEQLHAFGGNDPLPLVPLAATPVACTTLTLVLVRHRDAGAGMVRADDTKNASTRMLSRPVAFASRRRIGEVIAWGLGVVVLGLLSGGLAQSYVGFPRSQPRATELLKKAGLGAAVTPGGFIAIMDVFTAVVLAAYAVTCVHADYDDETAGRLDLPYSNWVTRTRWAGSTAAAAALALVALTIVLALATWAGSAIAGAGISASDAFAGAANVLPVAILFLGLAMLLHGLLPAWTAGVVGGLAVATYMIELIGPGLRWPDWVLDLSPYHHLALVPAAPAAWTAIGVMLAIAVLACALGLIGYAPRDLR